MLLRALAYKVHPYRWATIGLTPDHIAGATLDDVQAFYRTHYHPSNAILSISADFDEERMLDLAEKWFAPLADRTVASQPIPGNRIRRRRAGRRSNATCPPRPCRWPSTWAAAPRRISIPPTWYPTSCRAATRRGSTNTWCRNSACWPRSTPTFRATSTRDCSSLRGNCCRAPLPNRPKRLSVPKSKHCKASRHRTTRSRRSKTSSRPTRSSAS